MPIISKYRFTSMDQEEFHRIDRRTTGLCFEVFNSCGCLLDESNYRSSLANRCRDSGFRALEESKVTLELDGFRKDHFLDLVVEDGVIYELKRASAITPAHEAQLLHYLMITGCSHGKIFNFGSDKVESRFVSTRLDYEARQRFRINFSSWKRRTPLCGTLPELVQTILREFGSHLQINFYRSAILHQLGGEAALVTKIPLFDGSTQIGSQQVSLLEADTALHFSGITTKLDYYRIHLLRFLKTTRLRALQWINFAGFEIQGETLQNPSPKPK